MRDLILSLLGIGIIVWVGYGLLFGGGRQPGANNGGNDGGGTVG